MRRAALVSAAVFCAGVLGLSACGSEAEQPAASEPQSAVDETATAETPAAETPSDASESDDEFNKPGVVMMLESQLGAFGGTGRWEDDALIMTFANELEGGDGLDLAFVCDFMNGMVLDTHTTAVETPSGTTDCTA